MSEKKIKRSDWFTNVSTGMGTSIDRSMNTTYVSSELAYSVQVSIYDGDWLTRKACMKPVSDVMRNGFTGDADAVYKRNGIYKTIKKACSTARAFGGAIIVVLANDGKESQEPLTELRDGEFRLVVLDRYQVSRVGSGGAFFDDSEYININGVPFHNSRVIEVQGLDCSHDRFRSNQFWGVGVINMAYKAIASLESIWSSIEQIASDSSVGVIKIPGLDEAVNSQEIMSIIQKRIDYLNQNKSVYRMMGIGEDENFEWVMRTFQGVDMLSDIFQLRVAGATGIPESILFGKETGGLGTGGNRDQETYDDLLVDIRDDMVMPALEWFGVALGVENVEPTDISHTTAMEIADIRLKHSQALVNEVDTMGMDEAEARLITKKIGLDFMNELSDNPTEVNNFSDEGDGDENEQ